MFLSEGVPYKHVLSTGETRLLGPRLAVSGFPSVSENRIVLREWRDDSNSVALSVHDLDSDRTVPVGSGVRDERGRFLEEFTTNRWLAFQTLISVGGESFPAVRIVDLNRLDELPDLPPVRFRRGDCNDDGTVDISDAVFSLGSLFLGDGDPGCDDACDSNDDGAVDISDAINTLGVLFLGHGEIPFPRMTDCVHDLTGDALGCDSYDACSG